MIPAHEKTTSDSYRTLCGLPATPATTPPATTPAPTATPAKPTVPPTPKEAAAAKKEEAAKKAQEKLDKLGDSGSTDDMMANLKKKKAKEAADA